MRESARNDILRTHANFAHVHKCKQNTTYPYTLSHFIKCRNFWQITHLIVNCNIVLPWPGVGVFYYYLLLNLRSPHDYMGSSVPPFVRSRLWYFLSPLDGASVREAH